LAEQNFTSIGAGVGMRPTRLLRNRASVN